MILDKHKNHIFSALEVIHECAQLDDAGQVSYKIGPGFSTAKQILHSLVKPRSLSKTQSSRCISRALKKHSKLTEPNINRFLSYLRSEINNEESLAKNYYEVIRSAYSQIPIDLKPRRLQGIYIRSGTANFIDDRYIFSSLPKPVKRAVKSRKILEDIDKTEEYLPNFYEGNLIIAARVYANNFQIAQELASSAIDRYFSLLNFITGLGRGSTWFSNPIQPQAIILPSVYTTVHHESGKFIDNAIFFNPELALISRRGQSIKADQADKIDAIIDFIIKRINLHFDREMLWDGLSLYGSSYTGTDRNNNFLKCWMALERLMCFSPKESHESMIKRIRFILSREFFEIEYGILETLREKRNSIAHRGHDISDEKHTFTGTTTSSLMTIVQRLLIFHLHLPSAIKSKDDFVQFSSLPIDSKSLKTRQSLNSAMLEIVK